MDITEKTDIPPTEWWEEIPAEYAAQAYFPCGFPVARRAWETLKLQEVISHAPLGTVREQIACMRDLSHRMYAAGLRLPPGGLPVRAGRLLAFGLLAEAFRYVFDVYWKDQNPTLIDRAVAYATERLGKEHVNRVLSAFVRCFPPRVVYREDQSPETFLEETSSGHPNRHIVARELVLLALLHEDPALEPFRPLFDDAELRAQAPYLPLAGCVESFAEREPPVEPLDMPVISCLRAPVAASPDSLEGQVEYIRTHWAGILPKWMMRRLLAARDVMREETWMRGFGPGTVEALRLGREAIDFGYPEPEAFTRDADWMSTVVIIAKIIYVWMDQLSRRYGRAITRLDQVPDEELDRLARWGFTGLWLIGVWERSVASQHIKQRMGNPEAAASAYSLYDYVIAQDLGGEPALLNLRERAWKRGIRLATDMVPNHVGIYSKWVIEHPDWFLQCGHPPFPSYQFTGPDLCPEARVSLRIEDGYWDRRDAAVVFQRVDNWTGDVRYIYHGNDGTNMPWNDTAQLNYLLPEVREAVIQTILRVVRDFPIVRFDAAMTLTKRHYQRLWFPLPGEGGAIPSRSEHSMTRAQFDAAMPEEFWRQVVDRITTEVPDTLLIAEAFWLMEGYFVRTLGMHRVYNSAFMNMLKMEDNLKYRMTVKNVLEFSPEVLKRFVNFMNNPDELTAIEQFGKDDKYFGVAVMMVTMPGLPMFGHGQIEGFREKYGMEYRRAYWDEAIDEELLRRHEREIFPLMRRRHLFSSVEHFAFYDFIHADQYVDENVFAYSNRVGDQRVLVIFNNAYASTRGRIHASTAINVGQAEQPRFVHKTLSESLGIKDEPDVFYLFQDHRDGLRYIRAGAEIARSGLYFVLQGYQYHAFLDFEEVKDARGIWRRVAERLQGAGARDIHRVYREILLAPVLEPLRRLFDPAVYRGLTGERRGARTEAAMRARIAKALRAFLNEAGRLLGVSLEPIPIVAEVLNDMKAVQEFPKRIAARRLKKTLRHALLHRLEGTAAWTRLYVWAVVRRLEEVLAVSSTDGSAAWLREWMIAEALEDLFRALGESEEQARRDADLAAILTRHTPELLAAYHDDPTPFFEGLLEDEVARTYLRVNEFGGAWWLGKEQLEDALAWLQVCAAFSIVTDEELTRTQQTDLLASRYACVQTVLDAAEEGGYQIDAILRALRNKH